MIEFLITVRNVSIALLLAWMGFSVAPEKEDSQESSSRILSVMPAQVF